MLIAGLMHPLNCPNHDNLLLCTLMPRHAGAQLKSVGAKKAHGLPRSLLDSIFQFPINHTSDESEVYGKAGRGGRK